MPLRGEKRSHRYSRCDDISVIITMFSTFSCNHTGMPQRKGRVCRWGCLLTPCPALWVWPAVETARLRGMLHQPEQGVSPTLSYRSNVYYCASSENHFNVQSFQYNKCCAVLAFMCTRARKRAYTWHGLKVWFLESDSLDPIAFVKQNEDLSTCPSSWSSVKQSPL